MLPLPTHEDTNFSIFNHNIKGGGLSFEGITHCDFLSLVPPKVKKS